MTVDWTALMANDPIELIYALTIAVLAIQLIYRVCERMVDAMQDLEDEQDDD